MPFPAVLKCFGMGKKATKKLVGHSELLPGEHVIDACWGAGANMMKWGGALASVVASQRLSTQEQRREVAGKGDSRADVMASNGSVGQKSGFKRRRNHRSELIGEIKKGLDA